METEHIIPSGNMCLLNLTVACGAFNKTKYNWNPDTEELGYKPSVSGKNRPTDGDDRKRLLTLVREYVQGKWNQNQYSEEIFEMQMREGSDFLSNEDSI